MTTPVLRILHFRVRPLFELGLILVTPKALELIGRRFLRAEMLLVRHVIGDWGDTPEPRRIANEIAARRGGEVISTYLIPPTKEDKKLNPNQPPTPMWVVTDADRLTTTFMTPGEY